MERLSELLLTSIRIESLKNANERDLQRVKKRLEEIKRLTQIHHEKSTIVDDADLDTFSFV